jgi:hypothetical protein
MPRILGLAAFDVSRWRLIWFGQGTRRTKENVARDRRPEFTLLRFDSAADVAALEAAAYGRRLPLSVLDVEGSAIDAFNGALILSRPDQQVAWRGKSLPADPPALIDRVRGASN